VKVLITAYPVLQVTVVNIFPGPEVAPVQVAIPDEASEPAENTALTPSDA